MIEMGGGGGRGGEGKNKNTLILDALCYQNKKIQYLPKRTKLLNSKHFCFKEEKGANASQ